MGLKIRSMKRDKGIESLPFSKSRRPNRKARPNRYELERQICCRSTHRSCHDASDLCTASRRLAQGRVVGAVSDDGRSVGDLCFAVREVESGGWGGGREAVREGLRGEVRGRRRRTYCSLSWHSGTDFPPMFSSS